MLKILLAGLGGFVGSVCRLVVAERIQSWRPVRDLGFPAGTLAVNIIGCLLIGALYSLLESKQWMSEPSRALLIVGMLGGFTTFSAFGHDCLELIRLGEPALLALNVTGHLLGGIASVWVGYQLVRIVLGSV